MKITRQKPEDSQTERYLIIALIMSENVCRELKNAYKNEFFQSKMTREISHWCFEFFESYDSAPQQEIEAIFNMKSKAGKIDPDLEEEINKFLVSLSHEYEEWETFNEKYYVELGFKYFKKRSYLILSEQLKESAERNDPDEAEKVYSQFTNVQQNLSQSRYLLEEEGLKSFQQSLLNKPPFLFKLPGAMGNMIGPIERSSFIGLLGREKVGKTFVLMIFAIAALRQGLNVAMLETGDLTQDQLDSRWYSYFTKKAARERDTGTKFVPIMDCLKNQMGICDANPSDPIVDRNNDGVPKFCVDINDKDVLLGHERCIECWKDRFKRHEFKGSVWWEQKDIELWEWYEAERKRRKLRKYFKGNLVTEAFPMQTMKASDIRDWCINKQKQDGFIADLLIVDYPDILLPERNEEYRHQENRKWQILRQISQEFHNCVIVPTQADADSYNKDTMQLKNYSEDKRKYGHVTHFYGINKTAKEESLGCARLSSLLLRESSVRITQQVTILQCLEIAQAHVSSFFGRIPQVA